MNINRKYLIPLASLIIFSSCTGFRYVKDEINKVEVMGNLFSIDSGVRSNELRKLKTLNLEFKKKLLPDLIEKLQSANHITSSNAVEALSEIGEIAVASLLNELNNESWNIRVRAIEALGKIGSQSREAIEALIPLALYNEDMPTRRFASEALIKTGPAVNPYMNKKLENIDDRIIINRITDILLKIK